LELISNHAQYRLVADKGKIASISQKWFLHPYHQQQFEAEAAYLSFVLTLNSKQAR
jgi:hypothetical protein